MFQFIMFCRYYGVVTLIPIFQYSNVYAVTPKLRQLGDDTKLQERCITYASKIREQDSIENVTLSMFWIHDGSRNIFVFAARQPASFRDIYRMYSSMTYGVTMKDLCQRFNPQNLRINERKLVQFGLIQGLVRRIYNVIASLVDTRIQNTPRTNTNIHETNTSTI